MHWILWALIGLFALAGSVATDPTFDPPPQTQGGGTSDPDG